MSAKLDAHAGVKPAEVPAEVPVMGRRGTIPGWVLRLALALVAGALVAALWADGAPRNVLIILGLVALAAVLVPASSASAILSGGIAVSLTLYGDGSIGPAVFTMITLVHLLHILTGLVAVIPPGSRVHVRALRRPALRFAWIQAVALTLAALVWQLPRTPTPVPLEVAALLGVTALAVLVAMHPHRSKDRIVEAARRRSTQQP